MSGNIPGLLSMIEIVIVHKYFLSKQTFISMTNKKESWVAMTVIKIAVENKIHTRTYLSAS